MVDQSTKLNPNHTNPPIHQSDQSVDTTKTQKEKQKKQIDFNVHFSKIHGNEH